VYRIKDDPVEEAAVGSRASTRAQTRALPRPGHQFIGTLRHAMAPSRTMIGLHSLETRDHQ